MRANEIFFPQPLAVVVATDIDHVKYVDGKMWNDGSAEIIVRFRLLKEEIPSLEAYFNECKTQLGTTYFSLDFSSYLISDWNNVLNDSNCPCIALIAYIFASIVTLGALPLLDWSFALCNPDAEVRLVFTRDSLRPLEARKVIETVAWRSSDFPVYGGWMQRECLVETGFMRG